MTLLTEKFTFTKTTSTATPVSQEINLSGAFQPKLLILWTSAQTTSDGTYTDNNHWSFGFSDGTNDICQVSTMNESTETDSWNWRNDFVIVVMNPGLGAVSAATVSSFDADGFTLSWTVQSDTTAMVIHGIAIGGTDITNVSAFDTTVGDINTGNHSYNGTGTSFQPDFALMLTQSAGNTALNTSTSAADDAAIIIGAATSTTEQFLIAARDETTATSDCDMYINSAACVGHLDPLSGILLALGDFVSFNNSAGGGITINITDGFQSASARLGFLLVKGGVWDCGTFQQRSGTGTQDVTLDTGLNPELVFLTGINSATAGTVQASNYVCIGASDGTREGNCYCGNTSALGTYQTARSSDTGKVYRQATPAATASSSTTNAECDMSSMSTAGQFTLNWTTADTTLRQMAFWTVGTTGAQFNRSPATENITVADSSLTRILSLTRTLTAETVSISESLSRVITPGGGGGPITMTNTNTKTYSNKFITKV